MVVSAHTHPRTMMYAATVDVTRVALLRTDGSVVQTTTHAPSDPHNTQINSNDGSNYDARINENSLLSCFSFWCGLADSCGL
jgi:hypothetical protein